ncbi:MAG TPA: GNAT family N-acetyltransferase [Bdellovibrionales bacterium]|nr:GNAT family N-acetyltransferase [Bdellovibrionales bacterium]
MIFKSWSRPFTTKRLVLRPFTPADHAAWAGGQANRLPKQNKFDPGPPPKRELSRARFLAKIKVHQARAKLDDQYVYGVFKRDTGECLGFVDLTVFMRKSVQWANLGYNISNQYWGQGYATEAAKAALEIAFKRLKLHRVEAAMELDHKASAKVARGAGLTREGVRKRFIRIGRRWADLIVYVKVAPR